MIVRKFFSLYAGASLFFLAMISSSSQAADLLELYAAALDGDPQLEVATYDHQASAEVVTQAWSGYRPTITFDYDEVKNTQDILKSENDVYEDLGKTSFPSSTMTLTLTQPIFRYANYLRIGQAKEELRQADAELVQAQQDLILRVSEAYFESLNAKDELSFLRAERNAAKKQFEVAEGREKAKIGRAVDRYYAEARLATVEADYAEAEVAVFNSYEKLYEITGRESKSLATLDDAIDLQTPNPADDNYWVEMAIKQNPALVVQRHAVDVARKEASRQNAGHYPTLDLVLRNTVQDTHGSLFGGGSEVETEEMMLRLNVPIYTGGSVSSKKRQAVALHFSSKAELTRLARESRRQSREAYWGVVNAVKRVKALKKAVSAQEATLELRRVAYESRLETAINVLDAERDLYSAKRDLSRAKYDYLLNGLRLKAFVGILTETDLQAINSWLKS